jgi:hypothetical protein
MEEEDSPLSFSPSFLLTPLLSPLPLSFSSNKVLHEKDIFFQCHTLPSSDLSSLFPCMGEISSKENFLSGNDSQHFPLPIYLFLSSSLYQWISFSISSLEG